MHPQVLNAQSSDQKHTIEDRYYHQWPSKKRGLFFVFDDGPPRFPVALDTFLDSWGTIELSENKFTDND